MLALKFVYLLGHGLPQGKIDNMLSWVGDLTLAVGSNHWHVTTTTFDFTMSASFEQDTSKTYLGFFKLSWFNRKEVEHTSLPQQRGIASRVFDLEAASGPDGDRHAFFRNFCCLLGLYFFHSRS